MTSHAVEHHGVVHELEGGHAVASRRWRRPPRPAPARARRQRRRAVPVTTFTPYAVDLAQQVGDRAAELRASRQLLGEQHLATGPAARLVERDTVAALGRDHGGLQSCDAAAHHHHVAWLPTPDAGLPYVQLASGLGVLDARDRVAGVEVTDARLVAADAGADLVDQPVLGLRRHHRVADHRPGHRHQVGLPVGRGPASPSCGWLMRPATITGTLTTSFTRCGQRCDVGGPEAHRRHDVVRARQRRRRPGNHADVVERVVGVQSAQGVEHLVGVQALLGLLGRRDAQADDELAARPPTGSHR